MFEGLASAGSDAESWPPMELPAGAPATSVAYRASPARDLVRDARNEAASHPIPAAAWISMGVMFAYRISSTIVDLDLYHQMALIREWRALGSFPRLDLYAFTPTVSPLMHHEWGAGAIGYAVALAWGGAGILLLRDALGFAVALVAVRTALRVGGSPAVVVALAPLAMLLVESGYPPVRAHAYSFLLTAIMLYVLERDRAGARRWIWALAPLFVVWVNLHAGFAFGVVLLIVYGLERALLQRASWTHLGLVCLAVIVAIAVNPYGLRYYGHILRAITLERARVPEWAPLWNGAVPEYQKVVFCLAVGLAAYGLGFGRGHRTRGVLLLAATAGASAMHHRMLPFFGTAWIIYCPALLEGSLLHDTCTRFAGHRRTILGLSMAVSLVAGVQFWRAAPLHLRVPSEPESGAPLVPYYPVGPVAYLKAQHFRGNLLTDFNDGSYVLWKLYPDVKVSLDSRYEAAYAPAVAEELILLYQTGKDLRHVLEKYRPDALLVPRNSGLAHAAMPFGKVYEDQSFIVYARSGAGLNAMMNLPVPAIDEFP